jgi:hypothetical protein
VVTNCIKASFLNHFVFSFLQIKVHGGSTCATTQTYYQGHFLLSISAWLYCCQNYWCVTGPWWNLVHWEIWHNQNCWREAFSRLLDLQKGSGCLPSASTDHGGTHPEWWARRSSFPNLGSPLTLLWFLGPTHAASILAKRVTMEVVHIAALEILARQLGVQGSVQNGWTF